MSRTDKQRPNWVREQDPHEHHPIRYGCPSGRHCWMCSRPVLGRHEPRSYASRRTAKVRLQRSVYGEVTTP